LRALGANLFARFIPATRHEATHALSILNRVELPGTTANFDLKEVMIGEATRELLEAIYEKRRIDERKRIVNERVGHSEAMAIEADDSDSKAVHNEGLRTLKSVVGEFEDFNNSATARQTGLMYYYDFMAGNISMAEADRGKLRYGAVAFLQHLEVVDGGRRSRAEGESFEDRVRHKKIEIGVHAGSEGYRSALIDNYDELYRSGLSDADIRSRILRSLINPIVAETKIAVENQVPDEFTIPGYARGGLMQLLDDSIKNQFRRREFWGVAVVESKRYLQALDTQAL
jgi:hypothetical protein